MSMIWSIALALRVAHSKGYVIIVRPLVDVWTWETYRPADGNVPEHVRRPTNHGIAPSSRRAFIRAAQWIDKVSIEGSTP